ncbi:cytochrome C, partial [Methylobacterium radiotolerans]
MALVLACAGSAPASERLGIGRPASEAEIAAWNIDIDRDGRKLPCPGGSFRPSR